MELQQKVSIYGFLRESQQFSVNSQDTDETLSWSGYVLHFHFW